MTRTGTAARRRGGAAARLASSGAHKAFWIRPFQR